MLAKETMRLIIGVLLALQLAWLSGCGQQAVNSPYLAAEAKDNVLYTAFTQRSPKYLDPVSSYSSDETPFTYSIYEPLYGYEYLQRPYKLTTRTATEVVKPYYVDQNGQRLPDDAPGEHIAQSVYDIAIKPGILFQPHPAFAKDEKNQYVYYPIQPQDLEGTYSVMDFEHTGTRELTAHDYVYAFRRLASPRVVSPIYAFFADHIVGMKDYGDQLRAQDREADTSQWLDLRQQGFEGVEAVDDHTLRIRVMGKYPQFSYWLAMTFTAPIPWEADRFYQQPKMAEHDLSLNTWPVGTGPYMLTESIRNRRHVLTRNPHFRGEPYPCEGEPGDKEAGLLADCGKPTPFIDSVVFQLEKESVPLLGKFLQGYYDIPQVERGDYGVAMTVAAEDSPDKAALYKERGLDLRTLAESQLYYFGFNWLDPVVGAGDTPEQAEKNRYLRQAISIAFDWEQYVTIFQNDQGQVAHGPLPPGVRGYQTLPEGYNAYVYDLKDGILHRKPLDEAKALLAKAGYPDGRDSETGAPLILYFDSAGGMGSSAMLDWMRRQLQQLGIQLEIRATDYNRFQEKMQRGVAQMFMWGWVADYPDAENFLFLLYGPHARANGDGENASNYQNAEYDALFEKMRYLDDGPEKDAVIAKMVAIVQKDAPWMFGYVPNSGGVYQQWVKNAKPTQMVRNTLQFLRIDTDLRVQKQALWNQPVWWPLWVVLAVLGLIAALAWRAVRARERQTIQRSE
ncbi:MAG TPA: ABC transporter substrate-binding protein [Alcaligenaceae bacterium]|nr:ABC transporter substrate-binding protein [Alcaligenaceae bacterium]